jgi:hypothetical protein
LAELVNTGSVIALGTTSFPVNGCPCGAHVTAFSMPPGGWSGDISARPFSSTFTDGTGSVAFASDGGHLLVGDRGQQTAAYSAYGGGAEVLTITPPLSESAFVGGTVAHPSPSAPPLVTNVRLRGLATGAPQLRLVVRSGTNLFPVSGATISLPSGLRFNPAARALMAGVQFNGRSAAASAAAATLDHGVLNLSWEAAVSPMAIEIKPRALNITPRLRRQAQSQRSHPRRRHKPTLKFRLGAVPPLGPAVTRTIALSL